MRQGRSDHQRRAEPRERPVEHLTRLGRPVTWAAALLVLFLAGCQQRMAKQPSYKPLDANPFFADGRSARPLVPGTIARGHLQTDTALFTGRLSGSSYARAAGTVGATLSDPLSAALAASGENDFVDTFPFPITPQIMEHGYQRFMIYCVVCHDPLGTGHGKIVERGYTRPPSYHIDRLRQAPVGHFFAVITEGYGSMPSYAAQIPPRDRWAIVAYIRALQFSQHCPVDKVPADLREKVSGTVSATSNSALLGKGTAETVPDTFSRMEKAP
jgi:mono/diheme cytochrome c family protein